MMKFNPVSDWYFCRCIKTSSRNAHIFLSILEFLDTRTFQSQKLLIAYEELTRLEAWMMIYALPRVLHSLHRMDLPEGYEPKVKHYFDQLTGLLPGTQRKPFKKLLAYYIDWQSSRNTNEQQVLQQENDELFDLLKIGINFISRMEEDSTGLDQSGVIPYLDLVTFLPQTIICTLLYDAILCAPDFSKQVERLMERAEDDNTSWINVLRNAFHKKYGRLPYLLTCRIIHHTKVLESDKESLLSNLWFMASQTPTLEPDLLSTFAYILFGFSRENEKNKAIAGKLLAEFKGMYLWNEWKSKDKRMQESVKVVTARYGISDDEVYPVLETLLWQSVLLPMIAETDPERGMKTLMDFWKHPAPVESDKILVFVPEKFEINEEKKRWSGLAKLALDVPPAVLTYPNNPEKSRTVNRVNIIPPIAEKIFYSPWLMAKSNKNKLSRESGYHHTDNPLIWIRLVAALYCSRNFLMTPHVGGEIKKPYYAYIMHSYDAFIDFRNWIMGQISRERLDESKWKTEEQKLDSAVAGIMLFGYFLVRKITTAIYPNIRIEEFLKSGMYKRSDRPNQAEMDFHHYVIPSVMLTLINDTYNGAYAGNGEQQLLNTLPEVFEKVKASKRNFNDYMVLMAYVMKRFMNPDKFDYNEYDWRKGKLDYGRLTDKRKGWKFSFMQLYLSPELEPGEWEKPDWDLEDENLRETNKFIIAMERFAALKRQDANNEDWKNDFTDKLKNITETYELNRYSRLRLIEILGQLDWEADKELEELIAFLLLEFSNVHDLERLLTLYFFPAQDGMLSESESNEGMELRKKLIYGMHNSTLFRFDKEDSRLLPDDPQVVFQDVQKNNLILKTLELIAFNVWNNPNKSIRPIRDYFNNLIHNYLNDKANEQLIDVKLNKTRNTPDGLKLTDPVPDLYRVRAVGMNVNNRIASVYSEQLLDTRNVKNFFATGSTEISFGDQDDVLAIFVSIEEMKGQGKYKLLFNCGLGHYVVRIQSDRVRGIDKDVQPGDWVIIGLKWLTKDKDKGKEGYWAVSYETIKRWENPAPLKIGMLSGFSVAIQKKNESRGAVVITRTGERSREINSKYLYWTADLSRYFNTPKNEINYDVYALRSPDTWDPEVLDLSYLLLNAPNYEGVFVITLIEKVNNHHSGNKGWLVSVRPGLNAIIFDNQFNNELLSGLYEGPGKFGRNLRGLLITVKPVISEDRIVLHPTHDLPENEELEQQYPRLEVPWDYRNLEWSRLFSGELEFEEEHSFEAFTAVKTENGKWVYRHGKGEELKGFPEEIPIEWPIKEAVNGKKYRDTPKGDEGECILADKGWSLDQQFKGVIQAEPIETYFLRIDTADKPVFFKRYTGLQKGDLLPIVKLLADAQESRPFLPGMTKEGIMVSISQESLTMRPMRPDESLEIYIKGGRRFEVFETSEYELSLEPKVLNKEEPDAWEPREGMTGILINVPRKGESGKGACRVLWGDDSGQEVHESVLFVENIEKFKGINRLTTGQLVKCAKKKSKWHFTIFKKVIKVRALWKWSSLDPDDTEAVYLGRIPNPAGHLAEVKNRVGEVLRLDEAPPGILHMQMVNINTRDTEETSLSEWGLSIKDADVKTRVCVEKAGSLLFGINATRSENAVLLGSVRIGLDEADDNYFSLMRSFKFRYPPRRVLPVKPVAVKEEHDQPAREAKNKKWQKLFDYYLDNPQEKYAAKFDPDKDSDRLRITDTFRVPGSNKDWTHHIFLDEDHRHLVPSADYKSEDVLINIIKVGGSYKAALDLHPYRAEHFRKKWKDGKLVPPLYFAKKEIDEKTGETYRWFEYGFGKVIRVPEKQLRFDNQSIQAVDFILAHGDRIVKVDYIEQEEEDFSFIIDIKQVHVSWSEASMLYHQRKKLKMVHLLDVIKKDDEIHIEAIRGFNDIDVARDYRTFRSSRAKLNREQSFYDQLKEQITQKIEAGEPDDVSVTILGRLDLEKFEDTLGLEVCFNQVRLTLNQADEGLLPNEMTFMRFKYYNKITNDVQIVLEPVFEAQKEMVGEDFSRRLILGRRDFSVREDLLKKMYTRYSSKGGDNGSKPWFLVTVNSINNRPKLSMTQKMPSRKTRILDGMIREKKEKLLFVNAVGWETSKWKGEQTRLLTIEIHPGVYVRLREKEIELRETKSINRGDRLRISISDNFDYDDEEGKAILIYRITLAAPGDLSFATTDLRPVVVFPKNYLLKDAVFSDGRTMNREHWMRGKHFSVGDFPNLEPGIGYYNRYNNSWGPLDTEKIQEFMKQEFPKLGRMRVDTSQHKTHTIQIAPVKVHEAGKLEIKEDDRTVYFKQVYKEEDRGILLQWSWLTFSGMAVDKLMHRMKRESWCYHDEETAYWEQDSKGEWKVRDDRSYKKEQNRTTATGPLFFEERSGRFWLRYARNQLTRFGLPFDVLVDNLNLKRGRKIEEYTFAGESPDGKRFVEIVPGRVCELPANSLLLDNGQTIFPLDNISWKLLSPGDTLKVKLKQEEITDTENIILERYHSANRGIIGEQRGFFPVTELNREKGLIRLGEGPFEMTLPWTLEASPEVIVLYPQNYISLNKDTRFKQDDYVFVRLNKEGRLLVDGFFNFKVEVGIHKNATNEERIQEVKRVMDEVRQQDGCMPLNISYIDFGEKTLYVRFRKNIPELEVISGYLSIGDTAFIRISETGDFELAGFPGYKARVSEAVDWKSNPLYELIFDSNAKLKQNKFRDLVALLGGSMPVTVEYVNTEEKVVCFSRRGIDDGPVLENGECFPATIMGVINTRYTLLKCGARLLFVDNAVILPGMPRQQRIRAISVLADNKQQIWIRKAGHIMTGLKYNEHDHIRVRMLIAISDEETGVLLGAVCLSLNSMALFWMPQGKMAFTTVTQQIFDTVFEAGISGADYPAKINHRGSSYHEQVSLIDTEYVQNEFGRLKIGKEISAGTLLELENGMERKWLVRSLLSGILFTCIVNVPEAEFVKNEEFPVEVIEKITGDPSELIAVYGDKQYRIDLPAFAPLKEEDSLSNLQFIDLDLVVLNESDRQTALKKWNDQYAADTLTFEKLTLEDRINFMTVLYHDYVLSRSRTYLKPAIHLSRYISRQEVCNSAPMTLAEGLMAACILYQVTNERTDDLKVSGLTLVDNWKKRFIRSAKDLLRTMVLRSIRSRHVDVIQDKIISFKPQIKNIEDSELVGNVYRLRKVLKSLSKNTYNVKDFTNIRDYIRYIYLRNYPSLSGKMSSYEKFANALSFAIGEKRSVRALMSDSGQINHLEQLSRRLMSGSQKDRLELNDTLIEEIQQMIHQHSSQRLVLLENVFNSRDQQMVWKNILTHENPDLDAMVSVLLLKTFGDREFPGISKVEVVFCPASMLPDNKRPAQLEEEGIMPVDVGGGRFDTHPTKEDRNEHKRQNAATDLVARFLRVFDHPHWKPLIEFTRLQDAKGISLNSKNHLHHMISISVIIEGLKVTCEGDSYLKMKTGLSILSCIPIFVKNRYRALNWQVLLNYIIKRYLLEKDIDLDASDTIVNFKAWYQLLKDKPEEAFSNEHDDEIVSLKAIVTGAYFQSDRNVEKTYKVAKLCLDAIFAREKKMGEADEEVKKKCSVIEIGKLKIASIESNNGMVIRATRRAKMGDILIYKNPTLNSTLIVRNNKWMKDNANMRELCAKIRLAECYLRNEKTDYKKLPEPGNYNYWFLHQSENMILNGSEKATHFEPSLLSMGELEAITIYHFSSDENLPEKFKTIFRDYLQFRLTGKFE